MASRPSRKRSQPHSFRDEQARDNDAEFRKQLRAAIRASRGLPVELKEEKKQDPPGPFLDDLTDDDVPSPPESSDSESDVEPASSESDDGDIESVYTNDCIDIEEPEFLGDPNPEEVLFFFLSVCDFFSLFLCP
jgi:hypothetical protein